MAKKITLTLKHRITNLLVRVDSTSEGDKFLEMSHCKGWTDIVHLGGGSAHKNLHDEGSLSVGVWLHYWPVRYQTRMLEQNYKHRLLRTGNC